MVQSAILLAEGRLQKNYQYRREVLALRDRKDSSGKLNKKTLKELENLHAGEEEDLVSFQKEIAAFSKLEQWQAYLFASYSVPEIYPGQQRAKTRAINLEADLLEFLQEQLNDYQVNPGDERAIAFPSTSKINPLIRGLVGRFCCRYLVGEDSPSYPLIANTLGFRLHNNFPQPVLDNLLTSVIDTLPEDFEEVKSLIEASKVFGKAKIFRYPSGAKETISRFRHSQRLYIFSENLLTGKGLTGFAEGEAKIPVSPLIRLLLFRFCKLVYGKDFAKSYMVNF